MALFRAQDPCVVEGLEAEKSTEALRIMVPALAEPELCTLADSAGAQLLEATHLLQLLLPSHTIKTAPLMF